MFLFHSCNHALTPHFHQFTLLVAGFTGLGGTGPDNHQRERVDFLPFEYYVRGMTLISPYGYAADVRGN